MEHSKELDEPDDRIELRSVREEMRALQKFINTVAPLYQSASMTDIRAVGTWQPFLRYALRWMSTSNQTVERQKEARGLAAEYLMQSILREHIDQRERDQQVRRKKGTTMRFWNEFDEVPHDFSIQSTSPYNWKLFDKIKQQNQLASAHYYPTQGEVTEFDTIIVETDDSSKTVEHERIYCVDVTTRSMRYLPEKVEKQASSIRHFVCGMQNDFGTQVHHVIFQMVFQDDQLPGKDSALRGGESIGNSTYLVANCGEPIHQIASELMRMVQGTLSNAPHSKDKHA